MEEEAMKCPICGKATNRKGEPMSEKQVRAHVSGSHDAEHADKTGSDVSPEPAPEEPAKQGPGSGAGMPAMPSGDGSSSPTSEQGPPTAGDPEEAAEEAAEGDDEGGAAGGTLAAVAPFVALVLIYAFFVDGGNQPSTGRVGPGARR